MAHAEVTLPETVAVGFEEESEFPVDIIRNLAGHEFRNLNAQDSTRRYQASIVGKSRTETAALIQFYEARQGPYQSFNLKDHFDYSVSLSQGVFYTVSGQIYQFYKRYTQGGATYDRKINKLSASGVIVRAGSTVLTLTTDYTVDATTGRVTIVSSSSPTPVPTSWSADLFYVPVRFTGARKIRSLPEDPELFTWGDLGLVEVLNP